MTTKLLGHSNTFNMHVEGANPCVYCGAEITGEVKFYVEIDVDNCAIISAGVRLNDAFIDRPESQGFFPIGPKCGANFYLGTLHDKLSTPSLFVKAGA